MMIKPIQDLVQLLKERPNVYRPVFGGKDSDTPEYWQCCMCWASAAVTEKTRVASKKAIKRIVHKPECWEGKVMEIIKDKI
jgi:hypothetical protein